MSKEFYAGDTISKDTHCSWIVATAGDAKSKIYESLAAAAEGNFEDAQMLLDKGKDSLIEARKYQHSLLTREAQGCEINISVLLNHAMDILITAETELNIAKYVFQLFKRTHKDG